MKKNICLILTATIDPKGMTFLARSNIKDRSEVGQVYIKYLLSIFFVFYN